MEFSKSGFFWSGITSTCFSPDVQICSAAFFVILWPHSTRISPARGLSAGYTMSPTAILPSIFVTLRPSTIVSTLVA
jgi:hypothetical protein